jgi:hypothetical protein
MKNLAVSLMLVTCFLLSCSQKTRHEVEEASPVKTYQTLKTKTDTIQSKAQQHSNTLDSIAGQ